MFVVNVAVDVQALSVFGAKEFHVYTGLKLDHQYQII